MLSGTYGSQVVMHACNLLFGAQYPGPRRGVAERGPRRVRVDCRAGSSVTTTINCLHVHRSESVEPSQRMEITCQSRLLYLHWWLTTWILYQQPDRIPPGLSYRERERRQDDWAGIPRPSWFDPRSQRRLPAGAAGAGRACVLAILFG